jgi:hypothetical protein
LFKIKKSKHISEIRASVIPVDYRCVDDRFSNRCPRGG